MEKDKLEPKLRFPGFTEPWEQREFEDIVKVKGFKNFVAEPGSFGKFPVIQQGDNPLAGWSDNEPIADANKYVLFGDHTLSLYKPNSPFLVTSDGIKIFFANGLDRDFFYYLLQRYKPNSEVYKRHYSILKKTSCYLPKNLLEQKQIGVFFDAIDLVITLHQRKEEELQKLKKGLLQKMFPKDGESVPEVRFPNFTDSWEHRKLATIATFAKGRGYSKNDLTDRGTPLILYGRLYTNYSSAIETVDTYAKPLIGSVYSKGGEVIVPASGETAEDIARASAVISKGFLLGGDLNIINPNSEIDPVFLALQLSNGYLKKELASKAQGKSVVHIHNSDLENLQIIYPSLVEQMKVSTCIRVFEHLITLHQRKTEELKKLKKALLQQMFV